MSVSTGAESTAPYVEVSCRVDDKRGSKRRRPLLDCATVRFEDAVPVRPFRWSWGGRHFPGWYWAATTGQHVGFEAWLERDRLVLMDFDPAVVGMASQPFWLHWHDGERERRHARTSSCAGSMARRLSSMSVPTAGSLRGTPKRST
ncbi:hypothetical protein GCM10009863_21850 [Streptomyces axinellae]|uniref:TnsA-like heteromeric transposase endonuclease subunit n=1 Tax=Streptomyces axinellae TaxID=552788 RepID=A0ABP6CCC2_9ACTN